MKLIFTMALLSSSLSSFAICANGQDRMQYLLCLDRAATSEDVKLNSVYRQLISKLDDNAKEKLVAAQRTWITLRDQDCAFDVAIGGGVGGQGESEDAARCLYEQTASRVKRLKKALDIL